MMQDDALPPDQRAHPVQLEIEYPERLSRGLALVKWLLVIPHLFAVYLLMIAVQILTVLAWFAILFTGRYPKAFFEFNSGVLRWASNAFAYFALLRDEYPPFSWEPGQYPLALQIPMAERQSRFRLFIRLFAIIPNYIVFYFVQIAWFFTTFIAWFAIVITGRYPRGLFRFSAGVMRWYNRQYAYLLLLRDEYPPYSINAAARPGNELVSTIIGLPIGAAYIGLYALFAIVPMIDGGETVNVLRADLNSPSALAAERPSAAAGNVRLTLAGYDADAAWPGDIEPPYFYAENARAGLDSDFRPWQLVSFAVIAEKDGFLPTFYTPFLFNVDVCGGWTSELEFDATADGGTWFDVFVTGGHEKSTVFFWIPEGTAPCRLNYNGGPARIHFQFR